MTNSEVKNSQLIISKLAEIFGDDIMPANLINSSLNNEGFDLFI